MAKNNQPAFPEQVTGGCDSQGNLETRQVSGMTLRDYFAAKAMAAIWADLNPDAPMSEAVSCAAKVAYELADAMLKARED